MIGGEIIVPADLPAISIIRLANIIAPRAEVVVIGIRPGEKLHECLISSSEAPRTYRANDLYIVANVDGKAPVFEYTSERALQLSDGDAAAMISEWEESR